MQRTQAAVSTVSFALLLSAAALPGAARAQGGYPLCSDLPNPIYARGTTAVVPMLKRFGAKLPKMQTPHTLVYLKKAACSAIQAYAEPPTAVPTSISTAEYYVESDSGKVATLNCNIPQSQMYANLDVVVSDVYWDTCRSQSADNTLDLAALGIKEFQGPVQGVVPIVPAASFNFNDIMSEELRALYACGAKSPVGLFTNVGNYVPEEGMRVLLSQLLGLPNASIGNPGLSFSCQDPDAGGDATKMAVCVANAVNPDATVSYTSTEVYDDMRDQVKALKVRGPSQKRAYWPDSSSTSRDKINLREGRYMWQSALKLVTRVDANGVPTRPGAAKLVDWLQGNETTDPGIALPTNIISIYAQSGVVPLCAMKVSKKTDAPNFSRHKPPKPCHCLFELEATGAKTLDGCVPCQDASACAAGKICSYGYCE